MYQSLHFLYVVVILKANTSTPATRLSDRAAQQIPKETSSEGIHTDKSTAVELPSYNNKKHKSLIFILMPARRQLQLFNAISLCRLQTRVKRAIAVQRRLQVLVAIDLFISVSLCQAGSCLLHYFHSTIF